MARDSMAATAADLRAMTASTATNVVVVGPGQLGRLFGGGALRLGARVTPVLREDDPGAVFRRVPVDAPVWLTVPEAALPSVADSLPASRRQRAIVVQNGLFARDFDALGFDDATIVCVWTSAKPGQPLLVGRRSGVYGPQAAHVAAVHREIDLPCSVLDSERARDTELVAKYAFILAVNGLGLEAPGTVAEVTARDPQRTAAIVGEALALGALLADADVDLADASTAVAEAFYGFAEMPARGRTAAARILDASREAREREVELPELAGLAAEASG